MKDFSSQFAPTKAEQEEIIIDSTRVMGIMTESLYGGRMQLLL